MRKLIAFMMVCGFAVTMVACGGGAKEETSTDSTATVAPAVDSTVVVDSTNVATDSTAAAQ